MDYSFTEKKRIRKSFSKRSKVDEIPNLLEIQKESYRKLLQAGVEREQRIDHLRGDVHQQAHETQHPDSDGNRQAFQDSVVPSGHGGGHGNSRKGACPQNTRAPHKSMADWSAEPTFIFRKCCAMDEWPVW